MIPWFLLCVVFLSCFLVEKREREIYENSSWWPTELRLYYVKIFSWTRDFSLGKKFRSNYFMDRGHFRDVGWSTRIQTSLGLLFLILKFVVLDRPCGVVVTTDRTFVIRIAFIY